MTRKHLQEQKVESTKEEEEYGSTRVVHHDAVTSQVWVQDSADYDETVTTGYKCECGARK